MAFTSLALIVPPFLNAGEPASGYVLKAYQAGTTTNLQMATDSTGSTLVNDVVIDSAGYPAVSGNIIIPHINADFKLALYPTQTAADADSGATWTIDNLSATGVSATQVETITTLTNLRNYTGVSTQIILQGGAAASDGLGSLYRFVTGASAGTYVDDGFAIIVPTSGDGSEAWLTIPTKWTALITTAAITAGTSVTAGTTVEAGGDTSAGDNAAMGYTATEGLILTGQGSTSDVTIKNDADDSVISIATGTTTVALAGSVSAAGLATFAAAIDQAEGSSIATAGTTDIGAATGNYVELTGSTGPITSLGTIQAGTQRITRTISTPTFTQNATSLVLLGGADITAEAGDLQGWVSRGSGNWVMTAYHRAANLPNGIVLGTDISLNTLTEGLFTGIPSYVNTITMMLTDVSGDGANELFVQLGDSGGIETAGYLSSVMSSTNVDSSTQGFQINLLGAAADSNIGSVVFSKVNSNNKWVAHGVIRKTSTVVCYSTGSKTLTGVLTQIQLRWTGADTFDAGSVNISYQ